MNLKAYAKINLGLDVIGILPNGYHEVKMVMQTIDLYDELTMEKLDSEKDAKLSAIPFQIYLTANSPSIPCDEKNLCHKAARLMADTFQLTGGVKIHLNKNIPVAAGMAGGSTDAAAVIKGINELFSLHLSQEEMMQLGVKIGADVPYCIMGGTALAEGIGEKLTTLVPAPDMHLLIAKPSEGVSTKYVYEHLDALENPPHPNIDGMLQAINDQSVAGIVDHLGNILESVTIPALPVIDQIKEKMITDGALGSLMSGSGPTVFGIFPDEGTLQKAYASMKEAGLAKDVVMTKLFKN